jgi:hypothetical protein
MKNVTYGIISSMVWNHQFHGHLLTYIC